MITSSGTGDFAAVLSVSTTGCSIQRFGLLNLPTDGAMTVIAIGQD